MDGSLAFPDYQRTRTFAALDGVRALAVLWVLAFHCAPSTLGLQFLRHHGDLGVDVFFVLSGFLITTLLLREPPAPLGAQLGRFYMRRSLRIFPLYYGAVLLYWGAAHVARSDGSVAEYQRFLPSLLLYWSDWYLAFRPDAHPPFVQAWSLAVEEKFYLLWPFAVLLWPRHALRLAAVGILAVIGWRAVVAAGGATEARLYYPFELRLDALLWGAVLAALLHGERGFAAVRHAARPAVFWTAALGLAATALWSTNAEPWRYVAVPLVTAVLLAGVVLRPSMPGAGLLRLAPLQFVGRVSYGVYVLHPLCISAAQRVVQKLGLPDDGLFEFALGAPLSVAAAWVSFRWFEQPFLRLKERFRTAPPSAASAAPVAPADRTAAAQQQAQAREQPARVE
ncbi:MAG: acyltransferase family protein [Planctomycetota bacterium]